MRPRNDSMTKTLVRLAAVLTVALCTSACSTIDDLIGDSTPAAPADSNGFPPDATPAANADGSKPDLAGIPDRPSGTTSPDAQRATSDSLAADATRSKYSSDALRGGTEPSAPPPAPPSAADQLAATNNPPPAPDNTTNASPPSDNASAAVPAPSVAAAPTTPVEPAPTPSPQGTQPAVPAVGAVPGAQPMVVADASLGFKPSTAPPLDPSISQFVASPIIAHYQETAVSAGVATGPIAPLNGGVATGTRRPRGHAGGSPASMSGAVVANLEALNNPGAASVYANAVGGTPQAVVLFPGDGTAVTTAARSQIRAAVNLFKQRGGAGYIKVVGHSSSRTANMPVEKHLMEIFAKSQERANAVAREIIREGVPASHVLVEAVGDSQPVYYESMPEGEAGNRRAEIFIQG
jgi:outer membrane protein OmpA-like peptidoglycan-associated protein